MLIACVSVAGENQPLCWPAHNSKESAPRPGGKHPASISDHTYSLAIFPPWKPFRKSWAETAVHGTARSRRFVDFGMVKSCKNEGGKTLVGMRDMRNILVGMTGLPTHIGAPIRPRVPNFHQLYMSVHFFWFKVQSKVCHNLSWSATTLRVATHCCQHSLDKLWGRWLQVCVPVLSATSAAISYQIRRNCANTLPKLRQYGRRRQGFNLQRCNCATLLREKRTPLTTL